MKMCNRLVGMLILATGCSSNQEAAKDTPSAASTPAAPARLDAAAPTAQDSAKFKARSAAESLKVVAQLQRAVDSAAKASATIATKSSVSIARDSDVDEAYKHIKWAWDNHGPCTRLFLCLTYINEVGITFSSPGGFGPFAQIWRGNTSAHDCIQNAKDHLAAGHRGIAVEWVMASQIHNPPVKDWLRTHPDAVVEALGRI